MNRLGGVGLAALERHRESERSFATLSDTISRSQVDNLRSQLTQFRSALQHFASTHRDKIKRDPAFRHAFSQMCANIGVDPLTDASGSGRRGAGGGGWWSEILGLGDWNLELGVQVVDICVSTRERNGGLIEMSELVRLLGKLQGSASITEEDVVRSIKTLKPLGCGYEVLEIGGRRMVRSVTKELDADQGTVLSVARQSGGRITERMLADKTGWTQDRARAALDNMLIRDGLCWLDEQDEQSGRSYWIVSMQMSGVPRAKRNNLLVMPSWRQFSVLCTHALFIQLISLVPVNILPSQSTLMDLYFSRRRFFETSFYASNGKSSHTGYNDLKEVYRVSTTVRKLSFPDTTTIECVSADDSEKQYVVATIHWRWPSQIGSVIDIDGKRFMLQDFLKRDANLLRTHTHVMIGEERFTWRSAVFRPAQLYDSNKRSVARYIPKVHGLRPIMRAISVEPGCLHLEHASVDDSYTRDMALASFFVYRACRDMRTLITPWWREEQADFTGMRVKA